MNSLAWQPQPDLWREQYAQSGYVVVENVLAPALRDEMSDELDAIERAVADDSLPPHLRKWVATG